MLRTLASSSIPAAAAARELTNLIKALITVILKSLSFWVIFP